MPAEENNEHLASCLQFDLQPGFCACLRGPGHLRITAGIASLFGSALQAFAEIQLREYVVYPLETDKGASFEYKTTSSGHVVHRGTGIPREWKEHANIIANSPSGQAILVVGAVDCGKSSFITYLANTLLQRFEGPVAVIDTDVGQSKIGPPGTIGLGLATKPFIGVEDIQIEAIHFIGDKSPRGNLLPIILGLNSLIQAARSVHPHAILVDTSGFVVGPAAAALKLAKVEIVAPQWIVGLQQNDEMQQFLNSCKMISKILHCEVPQRLQPVSHEVRIARRRRGWRSLKFESEFFLQVDEMGLLGSPFSFFEPAKSELTQQLEEILGPCLVSRLPDRISVLFRGAFPNEDIFYLAKQFNSVIAGYPVMDFQHHYVGLLNETF
ncbi:MAG: Clp1/GlmU family protein, partial [Candidatus Hodarchaeota archaeon]